MRKITVVIAAAALCVTAAQVLLGATQPQRIYRVTILTDAVAQGRSINNLGLIAGSLKNSNGSVHASVWAFGHQLDLGVLGTGTSLNSRVLWPVKNGEAVTRNALTRCSAADRKAESISLAVLALKR